MTLFNPAILHGPDIAPDGGHPERQDYRQVILNHRWRQMREAGRLSKSITSDLYRKGRFLYRSLRSCIKISIFYACDRNACR